MSYRIKKNVKKALQLHKHLFLTVAALYNVTGKSVKSDHVEYLFDYIIGTVLPPNILCRVGAHYLVLHELCVDLVLRLEQKNHQNLMYPSLAVH